MGATGSGVHHTLHPAYSSYQSDGYGSNRCSAKDIGLLMERIYRWKAVSRTYSAQMRDLLLQQERRWKIPTGLPSGIKCANKTGETDSYQHDAADATAIAEYFGLTKGVENGKVISTDDL